MTEITYTGNYHLSWIFKTYNDGQDRIVQFNGDKEHITVEVDDTRYKINIKKLLNGLPKDAVSKVKVIRCSEEFDDLNKG